MKPFPTITAAALAALVLSSGADASIILTSQTSTIPADSYTDPSSSVGTVLYGNTGSSANGLSPFADRTSPYLSVVNGYATYMPSKLSNTLSFVWGSPDDYNILSFYDSNGQVGTFTGAGLGSSSKFVTLTSSSLFNRVDFFSSLAALEVANVAFATTPIQPTLPLFGAALLVIGAVGFARQKQGIFGPAMAA